ncbi:MAG: response regulator [Magnetococcales bacterium]|nr:response regulator [Magnetococcales bacterium]MBF0262072.1 response regulator [Magnetococcales bacterium]
MAKILIIDDDEPFRVHLGTLLRNAGHVVLEVECALNALDKIALDPFDLLITDIFMPRMDGFELLSALLRHHPRIRVIAMSGGGMTMSPNLALSVAKKLGATDLISKPFQSGEVLQAVDRALASLA